MGQLLQGAQGPQESQQDPNPEGEQDQHHSSLRPPRANTEHGHVSPLQEGFLHPYSLPHPFNLLYAPRLTVGDLTSLCTPPQETAFPQPPSRHHPHTVLMPTHTRISGSPIPRAPPFIPRLTGFPLGPSSPVGPLGPGGPASPACPASPFSPRSPRGPCRVSGGSRRSQGALEGQGLLSRQPQPPLHHLVTVGQGQAYGECPGPSSSLQGNGGRAPSGQRGSREQTPGLQRSQIKRQKR